MLFKLAKHIFNLIIGNPNIPEDKRKEYWARFNALLVDITKAAAQGAVASAMRK